MKRFSALVIGLVFLIGFGATTFAYDICIVLQGADVFMDDMTLKFDISDPTKSGHYELHGLGIDSRGNNINFSGTGNKMAEFYFFNISGSNKNQYGKLNTYTYTTNLEEGKTEGDYVGVVTIHTDSGTSETDPNGSLTVITCGE
jgi:hypothetical protein